jgi:hypothetical protein
MTDRPIKPQAETSSSHPPEHEATGFNHAASAIPLFEHDLFEKPAASFPDHGPA